MINERIYDTLDNECNLFNFKVLTLLKSNLEISD